MGHFVLPQHCLDYGPSELLGILQPLTPHQRKRLCGNSMHLVTQSAWQLYVLCNIAPRERPKPAHFRSQPLDEEDDEA